MTNVSIWLNYQDNGLDDPGSNIYSVSDQQRIIEQLFATATVA